jgi:hypothetical protein
MSKSQKKSPKRSRSSRTVLDILSRYKVDTELSRTKRLAHFLEWLAVEAPYQYVAPNLALKAIMGFSRTPRPKSDDVKLLQSSVTKARQILMDEFGRGLHVLRSVGIRATVDDQDCAQTQQRKNVERLVSAHGSVKRTAEIIDVSKVKDERTRTWLRTGVAGMLKAIDADGRLDKLLPPVSLVSNGEDKDKKGGGK